MSEWKEYRFEELFSIPLKNGLNKPSKIRGSGYRMVNMKEIFGYDFINDSTPMESVPLSDKERENSFLITGDLLFARQSLVASGAGKISYYSGSEFTVFESHLIRCRINDKIAVSKFIYYLIKSPYGRGKIETIVTQTAAAGIRGSELKNLNFIIPDLQSQIFIAEILSSLDDKIQLNNKINLELENLPQTLFKQWFIDFEFPNESGEPYQSSGGKMVESELGIIPKGWKIYSMSDLLETVSKTYPLKTVDEVVFLNTGDIQDGKFLHENISDPTKLPGQAKKSITIGDILYSEIRPQNKRFAYVHFDTSKYVVSTKLMVLRSKVEINSLFQYFVLTQKDQIDYLQRLAESRSGTFPQITFSEVSTIKIALPSFEKVGEFVDSVLQPFYDFKFNSEFENQELKNLRDTLLPKLISGEINVKDL